MEKETILEKNIIIFSFCLSLSIACHYISKEMNNNKAEIKQETKIVPQRIKL
jgi:hypothetical protein